MAQISKGDTFVDGQQVTGARLNQLVDSAVLLVGSISDQTAIAANGVAAGDELVINDGGVLKKATAGDILNSGLNTTFGTCNSITTVTSEINGQANQDIVETPNDGTLVTGKTFTSVDGITAVVSSASHGLQSNSLVDFSASNSVYSGQYFITVIDANSFSYVISQTTPVAASGTVDYTKKGTVKVVGNEHISGNLGVSGYSNVLGNSTVEGNSKVNGSLSVIGSLTSNGTANFTGTFQFNGTVAYGLYEVVEENISKFVSTNNATLYSVFTSSSFTKPVDEIWIVELNWTSLSTTGKVHYRLTNSADTVVYGMKNSFVTSGSEAINYFERFYINASTTYSGTFVLRNYNAVSGGITNPSSADFTAQGYQGFDTVSKFRVYKYKTA